MQLRILDEQLLPVGDGFAHANTVHLLPRARPAGLHWLEQVDLIFDAGRQACTVRIHVDNGYQEVTVGQVSHYSKDVLPWCAGCRHSLTVPEVGSGQYVHMRPPRVAHEAIPAGVAGRLLMRVPYGDMGLGQARRVQLTAQRQGEPLAVYSPPARLAWQSQVYEIKPGVLLLDTR